MQSTNKTIFPIHFCKVQGRVLSRTKPTKTKPKGTVKALSFTELMPVKFDSDGKTPVYTKNYVLQEKLELKDSDEVVYDKIDKIKFLSNSKFK
jgi:hypothetical protein